VSRRALGFALLILATCFGVVPARARELDLDLSRLSRGDCGATLGEPLVLQSEGVPTLLPDQAAFRALVAQISEAAAPTAIAPVTTSGPAGFDVALETTLSTIDPNSSALQRGLRGGGRQTCDGRNGDLPSQLVGNRLRFEKGLPLGLSLGALAGLVHRSGLYVVGVDAQLALLEEVWHARLPDLALRTAITRVVAAHGLALYAATFEGVLSRRFVLWQWLELSPFAGAGLRWTRARARTDLTPNIDALACSTGADPVCNAGGLGASTDDFAHDVRFAHVSQLRYRAFAGVRLRVRSFAFAGALAFDPLEPRAGDRGHGDRLPRQWTLSLAPSVTF
jgi:hypothetical protein